jgi:preprotein translocase subunit SecG
MDIAFGVILIVLAVALVALVLLQSGKDKKLSGTIAGGAETFFGKSKSGDHNKTLSIITAVISGVFAVVAFAAFLLLA